MEKKFRAVSLFALTGIASVTALAVSLGGMGQIPALAKTANKTLLISSTANVFAGTSLVTGSDTNYKSGNASPAVFHEISAATAEHSAILGTVFTNDNINNPADGYIFELPSPTLGDGSATATSILQNGFNFYFDLSSDTVYASYSVLEIGENNVLAVIPAFSADVSAVPGTLGTDYTLENLSTVTLYSADYSSSSSAISLTSGAEQDFTTSTSYAWALFSFAYKLSLLVPAATSSDESPAAPTLTAAQLSACKVTLTKLSLAWSC
jgi:hypothetical protein